MEQNVINQTQDWVDKLAAMGPNVTKDDIMTWANSVPKIDLKEYSTIPLFLYGDATIDKAITEIIQDGGHMSEPAVNDIYGALDKCCRISPREDMSQMNLTPEVLNQLPVGDGKPGDWNAVIAEAANKADAHKEPLRSPKNTVNRQRIGDLVTVDKYQAAHSMDAQDNSQNAVHFSAPVCTMEDVFNNDNFFRSHGFEACAYDDQCFSFTNGSLTYVIQRRPDVNGVYYCEDSIGNGYSTNDPISFVKEDILKQPKELQTYFSNKNFANEQIEQGVPVEPTIQLSMRQLANLMVLFQNDLLYMHHHAIGRSFDRVHNITQELYEKASDHVDILSEMAMRLGEDMNNVTGAANNVGMQYTVANGDYDIERMEEELNVKGGIILGALKRCQDYGSEVMSKLDELIYDWATEIEYKNAARMKHFARKDAEDVIDNITKTVTVLTDQLTSEYEKNCDMLKAKTLLAESKCQILKQKQLALGSLELRVKDDPTYADAILPLKNDILLLSGDIDALTEDIQLLLAQRKEFEDIKNCKSTKEFKKELQDIILADKNSIQTAAKNFSRKNFAYEDDTPVSELSKKDIEALYKKKVKKNDDDDDDRRSNDYDDDDRKPKSRRDRPEKSILDKYHDAEDDAKISVYKDMVEENEKLNNDNLQHINMLKKYVDESQKRKLAEIFTDYDNEIALKQGRNAKERELTLNNEYMEAALAAEDRAEGIRSGYRRNRLERDVEYELAKQHLLADDRNKQEFKRALTNGAVDVLVNELPADAVMGTYDKIVGNNLMKNSPYLDKVAWNTLGTVMRNKDTIGNIIKSGLAVAFSNSRKIDRDLNHVAERLLSMGFSHKQIEPVITGKMFARVPSECLDVDSMTKEAITHLTGSVRKGRAYFSKLKHAQKAHRNFSNENFELVSMHDMDDRYKFSITNPRYDYAEKHWDIGGSDGAGNNRG